jgi:hypothetical protein
MQAKGKGKGEPEEDGGAAGGGKSAMGFGAIMTFAVSSIPTACFINF